MRGEYSFNSSGSAPRSRCSSPPLGLLFGLVERDQRRAIARLDAGEKVNVEAGRIAGVSAAVGVLWLVILLLMIYKPGHGS